VSVETYIVKENRSYDQVLGDIGKGESERSLVLFDEKIAPNHHKLAREFVLLDNFYFNADVSADGHSWSTGAIAGGAISSRAFTASRLPGGPDRLGSAQFVIWNEFRNFPTDAV
jgi:hypothetical protein